MATINPLASIESAFNVIINDGFSFFVSYYGKKWHVTLNKNTYVGVSLDVKGEGDTIFEAVERALNNFPKNPLDGSRWQNDRLAGPVTDATFTETDDASST